MVSESARFGRPTVPNELQKSIPKKRRPSPYPVLLSCCLFLAILCTCLIAALVLIGNHLYMTSDAVTAQNVLHVFQHYEEPPKKNSIERLSKNDTRPIHYDLTLEPDLPNRTFSGRVIITLQTNTTKSVIVLNSKLLVISKATFSNASFNEPAEKIVENAPNETVSFYSPKLLAPGTYNLTVMFGGTMLNKIVGLYRSLYKNDNNSTRAIATSKFEPTYARQAFPCFDEPNLKAKYTVHILKPKDDPNYIALSNMPVETTQETDKGIMVTFQESVKMSTYLTCFIVCDFEYTCEHILPETDNVELRVYATPAQLEKTKYATGFAKKAMEYFIGYFGIKYPLPKLDLIAIPDFVTGATEHWGLVTFKETTLLYDAAISSTANKQYVARLVAHELTHNWFGNLVTMNWWNDLWLKEGFASYIQYKCVHNVYNDWQMLDQFLIDVLHPILSTDASPASHPIVQTVETPDQISEIFDGITYKKGASVLRMVESAIGEEIFRKGVTAYLKAHAFDNAVTQDLLDQFETLVTDFNVTEFVRTWTVQMGYPIISVTEQDGKYVLTQKRFLKNPSKRDDSETPYNYKWTIPITYINDLKPKEPVQVWFDHSSPTLTIEKPTGIEWIKFNHRQVGYYRVNYEPEYWENLAGNIAQFSVADKTHLLEESFSIAESNQLSYKVPLDLTDYLKDETEYIPWSVASSKLTQLKGYLVDSLEYSEYLEHIENLAYNAYSKYYWEEKGDETHLDKRTRVVILNLLCSIDYADCLNEAQKRFDAWIKDQETGAVSQDLRAIVYKYGMVGARRQQWNQLLELYKNEIDGNEKTNMMKGLAAVRVPSLLRQFLEVAKDETIVRSQDYLGILQEVAKNPIGTPIVWDYVRENWQFLVDKFTLNEKNLGKMIPSITSTFLTGRRLREMEDFFIEYPEAGAGTAARQRALVNVRNNIEWISKNRQEVLEWLQNRRPSKKN